MKNKYFVIVSLVVVVITSGCGYEESGVNNLDEVSDMTMNSKEGSTETVKTIEVDGSELQLETSYKVQNVNGWKFTHTAKVDLSLALVSDVAMYDIKVGAVYADVSIVSKKAKYHGLRQDSMFVEYKELSNDGINLTKNNSYQMPFMVEGINQNDIFLSVYNGTGSGGSTRLTEDKVSDVAYGASLNVVWTVYITNKETNQTYMKSINDSIGLPIPKVEEENVNE